MSGWGNVKEWLRVLKKLKKVLLFTMRDLPYTSDKRSLRLYLDVAEIHGEDFGKMAESRSTRNLFPYLHNNYDGRICLI